MNKEKLWIRRRGDYKCAGCGSKLESIRTFLCESCENTHPQREEINNFLEKYGEDKI